MEGSKVTSRTSSLKALLLRAWRERWTDLEWGIHIKTVLPRGVCGDVYNLADCILQQALVGSGPNQLVLSYLKHSLSSQLVSYAAVLQCIAKFDAFHKPHCVNCLLEFVENIQDGITCRVKPEEQILASAVFNLAYWLLQCFHHAATNSAQSTEEMLKKPASILENILKCDFLTAMLYLAKFEEKNNYNDVIKKCQEIQIFLEQHPVESVSIQDSLTKLCLLELGPGSTGFKIKLTDKEEDLSEPLTYCIQSLLAVQVMIHPYIETNQLANQLTLIKDLKGYTLSRLCCETIRAAMMSLNDSIATSDEHVWSAFTFIKLPCVIYTLCSSTIVSSADGEYSEDIVESVLQLLQFGPLIDLMDSPSSNNCIEAFLIELSKLKLLTDKHIKSYIASRHLLLSGVSRLDVNQESPKAITLLTRAQPTLQSILKTLDTDYSKTQEALPGILCHILSGKNLELILSIASVEGKLKTFVSRLIKFHECAKNNNHTLLFDIIFLMLCYIVQTFGSEVVFEERHDTEKSFFERWVEDCMVEYGRPKCPDNMLMLADPITVDTLLTRLNSPQPPDFSLCGVPWDSMCFSVASTMKEVVVAWEQSALSANDVKRILNNMRHNNCCLPICASAWLCSYMQVLHQDALLKPMNMVQQFLTTVINEDSQDHMKERSPLMVQVIRKMQYDMNLATMTKMKFVTLSHSIISREPMSDELSQIWNGVQAKGWLSVQATHSLESLFHTAGAQWFVTNTVTEIMKLRFQEDLDRAVDLAFTIFHLDIETCTEVLLLKVLLQYLHNYELSSELVEPQSSALAKLCTYCLYSAWENQTLTTTRKRNITQTDNDDQLDLNPAKLLRLDNGSSVSRSFDTTTLTSGNYPQEPLLSTLRSLMTFFSAIVNNPGQISQQAHFILRFLETTVSCPRATPLLQLMPSNLLRSLVRALPDMFTPGLILRLYDLRDSTGRKSATSDLCLMRNTELKPSM